MHGILRKRFIKWPLRVAAIPRSRTIDRPFLQFSYYRRAALPKIENHPETPSREGKYLVAENLPSDRVNITNSV